MRPARVIGSGLLVVAACACSGGDPGVISPDAAAPPTDMPGLDAPPLDAVTPDVVTPADRPAPPPIDIGPAGDLCPALCARIVAGAGCNHDMSMCLQTCNTQITSTPAPCRPALSTWFTCGQSSAVTCSGLTTQFTDCAAQQAAFVSCVASQ